VHRLRVRNRVDSGWVERSHHVCFLQRWIFRVCRGVRNVHQLPCGILSNRKWLLQLFIVLGGNLLVHSWCHCLDVLLEMYPWKVFNG
jgi:hypothetical protein